MGFFDNHKAIDASQVAALLDGFLGEGEVVQAAFSLIRDKLIFTNWRIVFVDIQGITGKKKSFKSIPYKSIVMYEIETAGNMDLDGELKLQLSGGTRIEYELGRSVNVKSISAIISTFMKF